MQEEQAAHDVLGQLNRLMEGTGLDLGKLRAGSQPLAEAPDGHDETAELYRAVINTPAGQRMMADLITRLCLRGTYAPGSDPSSAVYDAGMRAVILEMLWWSRIDQPGAQEETDDG